jgi:hypothetical protein
MFEASGPHVHQHCSAAAQLALWLLHVHMQCTYFGWLHAMHCSCDCIMHVVYGLYRLSTAVIMHIADTLLAADWCHSSIMINTIGNR